MRRELLTLPEGRYKTGCCPGHDVFPADTYRNRRSKKRRAKDKTKEHKYVRTLRKRSLRKELNSE